METTLIKLVKTEKFTCPTIVKLSGDYYLVSKKYNCCPDKPDRYIAINLTKGEWFDWGEKIPDFYPEMKTFEKGTEFTIKI